MTEEEKEVNYSQRLKKLQLQMLDKLGSGTMNQNDLLAIVSMMQKQEPNSFGEMMPMIMAMKMLNPSQKQDTATPMLIMMMMQGMKKDGGGEVDRKIERLESMMKEKEGEKQYNEIARRLEDLKKEYQEFRRDREKPFDSLALLKLFSDKDDSARKELLGVVQSQTQGQMQALNDKLGQLSQGGGIGRFAQEAESFKKIKDIFGPGKGEGHKSREEILAELIGSTATTFLPTVKDYFETLKQGGGLTPAQQPGGGLTPAQSQRLQQIQAQRQSQAANPANQAPQNPASSPEPAPEPLQESGQNQESAPQMLFGQPVFPDLVTLSTGERPLKKGE
jgi:hypothetical protein